MPHSPRSVRFDPAVSERLAHFTGHHPEISASAAVNRFVDEGLRMEEHPGILFRSGPIGRRAVVVGGPDVWQVVQAVRNARSAEPGLDPDQLLDLVARNTGVSREMISVALAYRAAFPAEVDAAAGDADRVEEMELARWMSTRELLTS